MYLSCQSSNKQTVINYIIFIYFQTNLLSLFLQINFWTLRTAPTLHENSFPILNTNLIFIFILIKKIVYAMFQKVISKSRLITESKYVVSFLSFLEFMTNVALFANPDLWSASLQFTNGIAKPDTSRKHSERESI